MKKNLQISINTNYAASHHQPKAPRTHLCRQCQAVVRRSREHKVLIELLLSGQCEKSQKAKPSHLGVGSSGKAAQLKTKQR